MSQNVFTNRNSVNNLGVNVENSSARVEIRKPNINELKGVIQEELNKVNSSRSSMLIKCLKISSLGLEFGLSLWDSYNIVRTLIALGGEKIISKVTFDAINKMFENIVGLSNVKTSNTDKMDFSKVNDAVSEYKLDADSFVSRKEFAERIKECCLQHPIQAYNSDEYGPMSKSNDQNTTLLDYQSCYNKIMNATANHEVDENIFHDTIEAINKTKPSRYSSPFYDSSYVVFGPDECAIGNIKENSAEYLNSKSITPLGKCSVALNETTQTILDIKNDPEGLVRETKAAIEAISKVGEDTKNILSDANQITQTEYDPIHAKRENDAPKISKTFMVQMLCGVVVNLLEFYNNDKQFKNFIDSINAKLDTNINSRAPEMPNKLLYTTLNLLTVMSTVYLAYLGSQAVSDKCDSDKKANDFFHLFGEEKSLIDSCQAVGSVVKSVFLGAAAATAYFAQQHIIKPLCKHGTVLDVNSKEYENFQKNVNSELLKQWPNEQLSPEEIMGRTQMLYDILKIVDIVNDKYVAIKGAKNTSIIGHIKKACTSVAKCGKGLVGSVYSKVRGSKRKANTGLHELYDNNCGGLPNL